MYALARPVTYVLWAGFVTFGSFGAMFYRTYLRTKDEKNRVFRVLMIIVMMMTQFSYLIEALTYSIEDGLTVNGYDIHAIQYLKWLFTTPILITQIGILEGIETSQIFMLCSLDILTISSGIVANYSQNPLMFYPLFSFGSICWFIVMKILLYRTFNYYNKVVSHKEMNNWVFTNLVIGIGVSWSIYPVITLLHYTQVIDTDMELIANTVTDVFSKGVFGLILIGAKEVEEGVESTLASLSRTITRVHPINLEPVREENAIAVTIDESGKPRRARRASIYLYTPPSSYKSLITSGSTENYSTASNQAVLPA